MMDYTDTKEFAKSIVANKGRCNIEDYAGPMGCGPSECPFYEDCSGENEQMVQMAQKWLGEHIETPAPIPDQFHPVDKPVHYAQGNIECIDAIQEALTPEEFAGFCKGNVLKYTWRERRKNGLEDLKKARYYLDRLIKAKEANNG